MAGEANIAITATSSRSAVSRAFDITELLEKILKEVGSNNTSDGVRTLLLSQRTCKAFRDTVNDSPTLRRALYFERSPTSPEPGPIERNPLLRSWSAFIDAQNGRNMSLIVLRSPSTAGEVTMGIRQSHSDKNAIRGVQSSCRRMHFFGGAQEPVFTAVYFSGDFDKRVEGRWVNPKLSEILNLVEGTGS
ncbi:hypothetical protein AC579_9893 [Pseudocercospora musae]|uniref:F-box domain-containing protein n=1 Tax=Pseudocercospora musae TaxID=113226 RepID=A0A139GYN1_9PEZI|nr:hypothetical protein AC579_9893 [Pseudocercospora musae]